MLTQQEQRMIFYIQYTQHETYQVFFFVLIVLFYLFQQVPALRFTRTTTASLDSHGPEESSSRRLDSCPEDTGWHPPQGR